MEQQKVLWIIFSVALFLVVVVVVGFVWFLPPEDDEKPVSATATAGSETGDEVFDPIVWVREDEEVPGMREEADEAAMEEEEDLLLIYGEAEKQPVKDETRREPEKEAAQDREQPVARTAPPAQIPAKKPARPSTAPPVEPTAKTAAVPARKPEPRTEQVTQYWIQLGSYRSQSRAEGTQADLAERGWNTRIISRDVKGEVYFRVRFGPFEAKDEAGKFLDWITDIETFESSYISEVYTTRTIN